MAGDFGAQTLVQLSDSDCPLISDLAEKGILALTRLGLQDVVRVSLDEAMDVLLRGRETVPDHSPELSRFDNAILPLMKIQRNMTSVGGPYDIIQHTPATEQSRDQQLLLDVNQDHLYNNLPDLFGVPYLGDVEMVNVSWPVSGILYGTGYRPMVCLPVQLRNNPPKNVFFLVDTGAPITELSPEAFQRLGALENIPSVGYATVAGIARTKVHLTKAFAAGGNHEDIPVLGADFMIKNRCTLSVDYVGEQVTISKV